jgi:hypothetical protein
MEWKYYDSYGKQTSAETIMFEHISQMLHKLFPKSLKVSGTIFSHQQNNWNCGYYVCIYGSLLSLRVPSAVCDSHQIQWGIFFFR